MKWLGRRYPSIEDLETAAEQLGAVVVYGAVPTAFLFRAEEGPIIGMPEDAGHLERTWLLAHEIGHLVQHEGPRGIHLFEKDEHQADRWAACALIPKAAVKRHQNASIDAFIAALSRHYEDIPLIDCPARCLAAKIAEIRLGSLEDVS